MTDTEKERSSTGRLVKLVLTYFTLYTGHLIPVKLLTDKRPNPAGGEKLPADAKTCPGCGAKVGD